MATGKPTAPTKAAATKPTARKRPAGKPPADPPITRAGLADALLHDADRLRRQLFAPVVVYKPMVVSDGDAHGSHIEIAEVELTEPTFADKKLIVSAIGIAVDKLSRLDPEIREEDAEPDAINEVEEQRKKRRGATTAVESRSRRSR